MNAMVTPHRMTTRHRPTHPGDGRLARGRRRVRPVGVVRPRRHGAFTLVELLVAIAVVSFLMVGIGQIFRSVGMLTSSGTAIAEVEQMARAIERQMRDDFESLSAVASEDTFIAIRMREIGDTNHNGALDANETAIYLTQEDRDADTRDIGDGVIDGPYDEGSRAITTRLDEISFIGAPIIGGYESFEQGEFGGQGVTAPVARISYGHALRPPRDPKWPPEDPSDASAPHVPQRMFIPDGDFGQAVGDDNRFVTDLGGAYGPANDFDFDKVTGRNEYAGSWILARQALLLGGGQAAGPMNTSLVPARVGNTREYAPFIRDLETLNRFWGVNGPGPFGFDLDHLGPRSGRFDSNNLSNTFPPAPRLLLHGRTDICAQDLIDVKRWLQGEPWPTATGATPVLIDQQEGYAYNDGRFAISADEDGYRSTNAVAFSNSDFDNATTSPRAALWQRPDPTGPGAVPYLRTRAGVRTAIVGTMTRLLAEDDPVFLDRVRDQQGVTYPIDNFEAPVDAVDAFMDQHAILASRCSNFEIAWRLADPDWPRVTARNGVDVDGDGVPELRQGDPVWIDITPLDASASGAAADRSRSTVRNWIFEIDPNGRFTGQPPSFGSAPSPPPLAVEFLANQQPELGYDDWRKRNPAGDPQLATSDFTSAVVERDQTSAPGVGSGGPNGWLPAYNPDISMGAPDGQKEYLAVWPFHAAATNGSGYESTPFPKRIQIRVRMTLHDEQNRLKGGKTFEFVFDVAPGG